MLYLRGVVDDFKDIDLFVSVEDANKAITLLDQLAIQNTIELSDQFQTDIFKSYIMDGVSIDFIAGFKIVDQGKCIDCSLTHETPLDILSVHDVSIPLYRLAEFRDYYCYMHRFNKVELIDHYLQGETYEN